MLPREVYEGLFKFAFVRNPWDLQVSSWHHIRRERPDLVAGIEDFADFLNWKLDLQRPPQYHADMSTVVQSDYVVDLHGRLIVDFIGRYENLSDDFAEVCRRIGIKPPRLLHSRRADDRQWDYRAYYSDRSAQLVADHYSADVERFQYRFDVP
jgi:hypothetical protein